VAADCDSTVWWEMVPDSSSDTRAVGGLHRHWCPQPPGTGRPPAHSHQQKVEQAKADILCAVMQDKLSK